MVNGTSFTVFALNMNELVSLLFFSAILCAGELRPATY